MYQKLHLYNTMSRSLEPFEPRNRGKVDIFTCGPSTYRRPHIGNYRSFLYEDILVRHLEYSGFEVHRVINFTDVEDKTIVEAENRGKSVEAVTREVHDRFFSETSLLGIKLPPEIPRSSTSVDQAVEIIEKLMKKGHAYRHEGNIYFDPLTFEGFGKLFRLDMSRWPKHKVRFKRDTYNGRRWNLGDFILWHGHDGNGASDAYWDTRIGRGRPSWNIQDPAMILQQIGTQIDINCGGIDNIYRHHDYNIAVMEAFSGKTFARYYLHGEHLIVNGKSMSKSRGNILYPEDLVERGYEHKHLRFFLIHEHYRKKLDFTDANFERASKRLDEWRNLYRSILSPDGNAGSTNESDKVVDELIDSVEKVFRHAMNDDLKAGAAFEEVYSVLAKIDSARADRRLSPSQRDRLRAAIDRIDTVLGVISE
jgi:cysteinyl-tRNA synthetase